MGEKVKREGGISDKIMAKDVRRNAFSPHNAAIIFSAVGERLAAPDVVTRFHRTMRL